MYLKQLLFKDKAKFDAAVELLKQRYKIPNRVLKEVPVNEDPEGGNYGIVVLSAWDLNGIEGYEEVSGEEYLKAFGV